MFKLVLQITLPNIKKKKENTMRGGKFFFKVRVWNQTFYVKRGILYLERKTKSKILCIKNYQKQSEDKS